MLMPQLSLTDPKVSAEGSIDPLGLYAIADALAVRLIPGVRERQSHPRFLTSIAVSLSLCGELGEELVAADEVSEPWQVFEWYVVEGLVRTSTDRSQLRGLPGQEKASQALQESIPLSAKRYLKTPTVFGFHGVYRALSRDTAVERADRLGEVGYELLSTWEQEQGLPGFCGTSNGEGKAVRRQLLDAIQDGLKYGAVSRKAGWAGWPFFRDHLGIYDAGPRESRVIARALRSPGSGFRREVMDCLLSPAGRKLWSAEAESSSFSERRFHKRLAADCGPELRQLLDVIGVYEQFSRLLQDAFDDSLHYLSQSPRRISPTELGTLPGVQRAAARVPEIFPDVSEQISPYIKSAQFQESFSSLAERLPAADWIAQLLDHHRRVQAQKPPTGKAPWFDQFDDGTYLIRTAYMRESGGRHDDSYVHAFRTNSLWSFVQDLGLVK